MRDVMMDGGMWGMGLTGWLVVLVLLLAVAALVKYVFFK
jgi:hypothetical protein